MGIPVERPTVLLSAQHIAQSRPNKHGSPNHRNYVRVFQMSQISLVRVNPEHCVQAAPARGICLLHSSYYHKGRFMEQVLQQCRRTVSICASSYINASTFQAFWVFWHLLWKQSMNQYNAGQTAATAIELPYIRKGPWSHRKTRRDTKQGMIILHLFTIWQYPSYLTPGMGKN